MSDLTDMEFKKLQDRIAELEDDARADNALLDWHLTNVDKLQARIEELETAIEAYRRDPTLLMPTGPGVDVRYAEEEALDE